MREHFGVEDVDDLIGNHLACTAARPPDAWVEIEPGMWRDEFGVVWDRTIDKDIGTVANCCLPEPTLDGYTFPDPHAPRRFAHYDAWCRAHADVFRLSDIGFSLFERAWTLRGMANLLMDMHLHPDFVDELLDAIVGWNLAVLRRVLGFPVDGARFGDDWGSQRGVLMGPELWRARFRSEPRRLRSGNRSLTVAAPIAKQYALAHEHGRPVFIHSCGAVAELFDDLIEIGVDCFNPFQPEAMDVYAMKRRYGDRISFYGGLSTQRTLPFASPSEVVGRAYLHAESSGAGMGVPRAGMHALRNLAAPAHDVPKDVPIENLVALIETCRDQASS